MKRLFADSTERVEEEELVSLVGGRRDYAQRVVQQAQASSSTAQITLSVKGMHCSSCSTAVENALK